jgi:hypothetical protein
MDFKKGNCTAAGCSLRLGVRPAENLVARAAVAEPGRGGGNLTGISAITSGRGTMCADAKDGRRPHRRKGAPVCPPPCPGLYMAACGFRRTGGVAGYLLMLPPEFTLFFTAFSEVAPSTAPGRPTPPRPRCCPELRGWNPRQMADIWWVCPTLLTAPPKPCHGEAPVLPASRQPDPNIPSVLADFADSTTLSS